MNDGDVIQVNHVVQGGGLSDPDPEGRVNDRGDPVRVPLFGERRMITVVVECMEISTEARGCVRAVWSVVPEEPGDD